MKLSDKGYEKLNKHAYIQSEDPFMFAELDKDGVCGVELETDDFKDCVALTLEEAKALANKLNDNGKFYFFRTGNFDHDTEDLHQFLLEKIEQAEGE